MMSSQLNDLSRSSFDQVRGPTLVPAVWSSSPSSQASEEGVDSTPPTSTGKPPSPTQQYFLYTSPPTIASIPPSDSSTLKTRQCLAIEELRRKRCEAIEGKAQATGIKRLQSQALVEKHKLSNRAVQQVSSTTTIDRSNLATSNSAESRDSQRSILSPLSEPLPAPTPLRRVQHVNKSRVARQQKSIKKAGVVRDKQTRKGVTNLFLSTVEPHRFWQAHQAQAKRNPHGTQWPHVEVRQKKRTTEFEVYNPILRAKMEARKATELAPLQIPVKVTNIQGAATDHRDDQDLRSQAPTPPSLQSKLWEHVKVEKEDTIKIEASLTESQPMDMDGDDTYSVVLETPPPVPELARLFHDFECHRRSYHYVKPYAIRTTTSCDFYPDQSSLALRCHRYETFLRRLSIEVEAVIKCPSKKADCHQDLVGAAAQNLKYEIEDELEYVGYKERCPFHSLFEGKEEEETCMMEEEEDSKRLIKFEV